MAWVGPIQSVSFASTTTAGTFTFSPTATIPAGTLLVIFWTSISPTVGSACSDNSVQAGTANVYTQLGGVSAPSLGGASVYCVVTRPILSTNVITQTTGGSGTRRSGRMLTFTGQAATSPLDVGFNATVISPGGAATLNIGPTSTSGPISGSGELAIASSFALCGAVASGVSDVTAGYTNLASVSSGGTTNRVETNVSYNASVGPAATTDTQSFTNVNRVGGTILVFKPLAGTAYTKSISGSLSFVGVTPKKAANRRLPGSVSFSGAVAKSPTRRLLPASITPTGALSKTQTLVRALVGAVFQPTGGDVSRAGTRSLAASITPTGALSNLKSIARTVTGGFTPTGALTRLPAKVLTGAFTPTGSLNRTLSLHQILDVAVLQPVGALTKLTSRRLTAVFAPIGAVASASRGALAAAFRPVGAVTHGVQQRTLTAAVSFAGVIRGRAVTRLLVSSLVASGVLHTRYIPPVGPSPPGGGGWGAPMPDSFFTRYKPTLRRQR